MTAQPTTQILLDASILSKSNCMLRLALRTYYQYAPREDTNNSLVYGSSFHKCVETYWLTERNEGAALLAAQQYWIEATSAGMIVSETKRYLDITHLIITCLDWLKKVRKGSGHWLGQYEPVRDNAGKPLVEIKFAIPFIKADNVEILLAGTIDGIYSINDILTIVDYKTTSSRSTSEYFRGYTLSTQLMLYTWALKWYAALEGESNIYRELIESHKMLGATIFAAFLQTGGKDTVFEQNRVQIFGEEQMNEMIQIVKDTAERLIDTIYCIKNAEYRPRKEGLVNGSCQSAYGSTCSYFAACTSPTEESFWGILNSHMKKEPYDPRTFGGGMKAQTK